MADSFTFNFPPEIEYQIFQHVVRKRPYQRTDAHMLLICKRVFPYIEPLLYETLTIVCRATSNEEQRKGNITDVRLTQLLQTKPRSFFSDNIKNIEFVERHNPQFVLTLLILCTGLQNLRVCEGSNIGSKHLKLELSLSNVAQCIMRLPLRTLDTDINTLIKLSTLGTLPNLKALKLNCGCCAMGLSKDYPNPNSDWLPSLSHIALSVCRSCIRVEENVRILLGAPKLRSLHVELGEFEPDEWLDDEDESEPDWDARQVTLTENLKREDPRITVFSYEKGVDWKEWFEEVESIIG